MRTISHRPLFFRLSMWAASPTQTCKNCQSVCFALFSQLVWQRSVQTQCCFLLIFMKGGLLFFIFCRELAASGLHAAHVRFVMCVATVDISRHNPVDLCQSAHWNWRVYSNMWNGSSFFNFGGGCVCVVFLFLIIFYILQNHFVLFRQVH